MNWFKSGKILFGSLLLLRLPGRLLKALLLTSYIISSSALPQTYSGMILYLCSTFLEVDSCLCCTCPQPQGSWQGGRPSVALLPFTELLNQCRTNLVHTFCFLSFWCMTRHNKTTCNVYSIVTFNVTRSKTQGGAVSPPLLSLKNVFVLISVIL